MATGPLPEIPVEATRSEPVAAPVAVAARDDDRDDVASRSGLPAWCAPARTAQLAPRGALVLGLAALAVVVAVVLIVVLNGGSSNKPSTQASTTPPTTTTAAGSTGTSTSGSTTSTTATKVIGQINLTPPESSSKAAGIAEILQQGKTNGIAIVAQGVPPNTKHDAYAVWLYNSGADSQLLGFVNPGVGTNGRLSTAGALPSGAGRFKELVVTLETQAKPKQPGTIVLQGQLTGLS